MNEQPLGEIVIIPVLPSSLQRRCAVTVPREGKDARVELYRALVTQEKCAKLKDATAKFYNDVRQAMLLPRPASK